ncbi:hypothetical protein JL106_07680 [Nakamurella sp. YIM 132084]|uniref:Uncharacterized protein n=1 Tax=Nakamurella leprariae TaxID=2803911 RepID=A0A938Y6X9_9ACTN|nr:hypothetical protein [Nakamurella leprariae]
MTPATAEDRADAASFAGRVARWDRRTPVRIRADRVTATEPSTGPAADVVRMWAGTPFDVLVARSVHGTVRPGDCTVLAGNLLAALAVTTAATVDPGPRADATWRTQLPPVSGWVPVDLVPATVLAGLAEEGVSGARERPGPMGGAPTALLDHEALTVTGSGMVVPLTMRVLFALSGMGFAPATPGEEVRVSATDAWLRLDGRYGTVLRRRHSLFPLLLG